MNEMPDGVHFAIIVDGHPRSYRDRREVALDAAMFIYKFFTREAHII
jgi:hypothetical protein